MKVLLAEDEDISRHILRETLVKWGFEVVTAADGAEAWARLNEPDAPQLVILDWIMPGMDGIDVCRKIRENLGEPYVYVLLLTSKSQKEDIIEGMDAGADDYVLKPFDNRELRTRLNAGRRIIDLQTQLLATRESLRYLASHDTLTGLYSRHETLTRLRCELDRASLERTSLGLIIADIDHFKQVNDTLGHLAGDKLLVQIAARMRGAARKRDTVGRYGGEEFLILLPGCSPQDTVTSAERIRSAVCREPIVIDESVLAVSISVGVVSVAPDQVPDVNSLIRSADAALYRAKRQGRNQVVIGSFSPANAATA